MSQPKIRAAIEQVVVDWAANRSGGPIPVAIQNKTFKPTTGQAYVRSFILPAQSIGADLAGEYEVLSGIFQLTVFSAVGVGPGQAERIADEIKGLFPANTRLTFDGQTVQIVGPMTVHQGQEGTDTFSVPISGRYRCDLI